MKIAIINTSSLEKSYKNVFGFFSILIQECKLSIFNYQMKNIYKIEKKW